MSEDVLERLSRANPLPDGLPAPAIEPLLEQLQRPPRRSASRRLSGALPPAVGIALVLLVAVAALLTVGRRAPRRSTAGGVPAAARQLISELGVLRRPQTPADRNLPAVVLQQPGVVRSLTRLVVRDLGMRVFLLVRAAPHSTQAGATAVAVTRDGRVIWLDNVRASFVARPRPPAPSPPALVPIHVSIVPDGVATVVWTIRSLSPHASRTQISAAVSSNLAITRFPHLENELVSRAVWYGGSGHVVAAYNPPARQARGLRADQRAIAASEKRPIARSLLAHFKLLRSPVMPGPTLPIGVAADYANQRGGLNVGMARFVALGGTEPPIEGYRHGVWVIPGSRTLCFMDTQFAGSCSDGLTSAESDGLMMSSADSGTYWITGIVPDGNPTVSFKLVDGTTKTVRVIDNVYSLATKTRAIRLTAKEATGRTVTIDF